jgi:hypothetical protein
MAKVRFVVEFEKPEGATMNDARAYLYDAVTTMRGCYKPPDDEDEGDPMWALDPDTVSISLYRARFPAGLTIHHIDGNARNNDISNLQLVPMR